MKQPIRITETGFALNLAKKRVQKVEQQLHLWKRELELAMAHHAVIKQEYGYLTSNWNVETGEIELPEELGNK